MRDPKVKSESAEEARPAVDSIASFCAKHRISKPTYHRLQRAGKGPREIRIGSRVLITAESAAAWRAALEGCEIRVTA
jgi:hypothetical protein